MNYFGVFANKTHEKEKTNQTDIAMGWALSQEKNLLLIN